MTHQGSIIWGGMCVEQMPEWPCHDTHSEGTGSRPESTSAWLPIHTSQSWSKIKSIQGSNKPFIFPFVEFADNSVSKLTILHTSCFPFIPPSAGNKLHEPPALPSVVTWRRFRLAQFNTYNSVCILHRRQHHKDRAVLNIAAVQELCNLTKADSRSTLTQPGRCCLFWLIIFL